MTDLAKEIASLPAAVTQHLARLGFNAERLLRLAATQGADPDARNRLPKGVQLPAPGDIQELPAPGSTAARLLHARGLDLLGAGQLAFVVLAGGMATRMGGVVKALVPALDSASFLDLRLAEHATWTRRVGCPVPLWLMTSHATDTALRKALGSRLEGDRIATFMQDVSLRLSTDGRLFRSVDGELSLYTPGHGDLPDALRRSGLLERFVARGGRYVWIANIDNLGASVDPTLLGWHADHDAPVTVEVVDKEGTDKGGIPVRWRNRPVILEEFRLPKDFDPTQVRVFNTNTFLVDANVLLGLDMEFTWVEVTKNVEGFKAVQFERLIGEITTQLPTKFVRVPRDGAGSRFLPVKDLEELHRRRDQLRAVAQDRGMLPE